jgi:hypothetical protein
MVWIQSTDHVRKNSLLFARNRRVWTKRHDNAIVLPRSMQPQGRVETNIVPVPQRQAPPEILDDAAIGVRTDALEALADRSPVWVYRTSVSLPRGYSRQVPHGQSRIDTRQVAEQRHHARYNRVF